MLISVQQELESESSSAVEDQLKRVSQIGWSEVMEVVGISEDARIFLQNGVCFCTARWIAARCFTHSGERTQAVTCGDPSSTQSCGKGQIAAWMIADVFQIQVFIQLGALADFIDTVFPVVADRVLTLTDDELKSETVRTLSEICDVLKEILHFALRGKAAERIETFQLQVAYKCFVSPYLDKRVHGLNEIKEMFVLIAKKEEKPQPQLKYPVWMTAQ